jgi:GlpG protein
MRHLTTITGQSRAEAFVAYLLTQDVSTHVESTGKSNDEWDVWIRDEDKITLANEELSKFIQFPDNPAYQEAVKDARTILKQRRDEHSMRKRNIQTTRSLSNRSMLGGSIPPLTLTLVILCVAIGLLSEFTQTSVNNLLGKALLKQLMFVDVDKYTAPGSTHDPALSLKQLQLWRIITPAFLHGSALHLLMNMFALVSLGRITERLEGMPRYAIILLLVTLASHLFQGLLPDKYFGSPLFVGISGVVMGLFGYLAVKTNMRPNLGFTLNPTSYIMIGLILVLGFTNSMGSTKMANMGHLGGLLAGMLVGVIMCTSYFDRKA